MVFTTDLGTDLHLPAVVVALGLNQAEYEPEQHPSVIYRLDDPAVVSLIFSTGKLVITGTTERTTAATALTMIADRLTDLGLREQWRSPLAESNPSPMISHPPDAVLWSYQ